MDLVYDVTFHEPVGGRLTGACQAVSPGFEHEHFRLEAGVFSAGFVRVEGYRDNVPGATHFFRAALRLQGDGVSMEGGYVDYDAEHEVFLVGLLQLTKADRIGGSAPPHNRPGRSARSQKGAGKKSL